MFYQKNLITKMMQTETLEDTQNLTQEKQRGVEMGLRDEYNGPLGGDNSSNECEIEVEEIKLRPRYVYLFWWATIILMGQFEYGYLLVYYGTCEYVINAQLGWTGTEKAQLYPAIITGVATVGLAFGAFFAANLMARFGKKRSLLIGNVIGLVGVIITLFQFFWTFVIGRMIFGFGVGIL